MLDFLSTIANSLALFLQFIGQTVTGLFQVFALTFQALGWLTVSIGYMPSVLVGFATTGIVLSILYLLLGR